MRLLRLWTRNVLGLENLCSALKCLFLFNITGVNTTKPVHVLVITEWSTRCSKTGHKYQWQCCWNRLRADGCGVGEHDVLRDGHRAHQVRYHWLSTAELSLVQRRLHHRSIQCTVLQRTVQHQNNILGIQVFTDMPTPDAGVFRLFAIQYTIGYC